MKNNLNFNEMQKKQKYYNLKIQQLLRSNWVLYKSMAKSKK